MAGRSVHHPLHIRGGAVRMCATATALILACALLSSCRTLRSEPFEKFANSATQVHIGLEQALERNRLDSRNRFQREAATLCVQGDLEFADQLFLEGIPGDPLGVEWQQAAFYITSAKFKVDVARVTDSLVQYAQLLNQLASPELLSPEGLKLQGKHLNDNLFAALKSLQAEDNSPNPQKIALFSTAANEAFDAYLRSKRKAELRKAITEHQDTIVEVSIIMKRAIRTAALQGHQEYKAQIAPLYAQLDPHMESQRRIEELKSLDASVTKATDRMKEIEEELREAKAQTALENKENLKEKVKAIERILALQQGIVNRRTLARDQAKRQAESAPKVRTEAELSVTIGKMMAVFEAYLDHKASLRRVAGVFALLPAAHAELIKAVDSEVETLEAINSFLGEGLRLQASYSRNRLSNESSIAQSKAEALAARVDALDARVIAEQLRLDLLKIRIERAKSDSNTNPDDVALKKMLNDLTDKYNDISDRLARLKLHQVEARRQAEEAQAEADRLRTEVPSSANEKSEDK